MNVDVRSLHYVHLLGRVHAVRGASLRIAEGESVGLIGPNGAGKSTLLGCLLGFLAPRSGEIRIDGRPNDDLRVRAGLGALAERPVFPAGMTARRALAFHHALLGLPSSRRASDVGSMLDRVGLGHVGDRRPSGFSHGMRQRLGLAVALLGDPRLLVLDEPATGLDPPGILLLREEILRATRRGATVILSSHQLDEVERSCRRVVFMDRGLIRSDMPMARLRGGRRRLKLRVAAGGVTPSLEAMCQAGSVLGAAFVGGDEHACTFEVSDDAAVARLLAGLLDAGYTVTEAVPEQSPLESLFAAQADP